MSVKQEEILLAHGSGGRMSQQLIEEIFKPAFSNPCLDQMLDGAVFEVPAGRLAMSTDTFVISPIFFPGGDIGKLSVCGTVNDLVACGAVPMYLSAGFVLEEGFPIEQLHKIADSMAHTAQKAGIRLVTGDTKVVERGHGDGIFINTAGVGIIPPGIEYHPRRIEPGDLIMVTGNMGDHGLAILACREGLSFTTPVLSDCQPLNVVGDTLRGFGPAVKCMRDPTRGGLATVLNELAQQSGWGIKIWEDAVPVDRVVRGACDMLGMDPYYLANEGKMVLFVSPDKADEVLAALKSIPEGIKAAVIGEVVKENRGTVLVKTELGAERILSVLEGEHLPRIC